MDKGYWPIYGTMKILDEMAVKCDSSGDGLAQGQVSCPKTSGVVYSYIALVLYMVIANVLLLNILIAMFRLD